MTTKQTGHPSDSIQKPVYRRLRGYAFDPSLSTQLDTAYLNTLTFKVRWEDYKGPGPCGEYFEVLDYDPASKAFYAPVDLGDVNLVAQDGVPPSLSNPQFHQQMVYAVAMTTVQNFEKALGRWVLWSSRKLYDKKGSVNGSEYTGQLRLYPHAFRDANAYYSPEKKAVLFGYFPAIIENLGTQLPGGIVFSCLSHDIIAHEITHAILDGINDKFIDATSPDSLAFHEAFADIIALFQHFTFPEIIKSQIAKTRGDLQNENLLGQLAQEFGVAIGNYSSLRDAIGERNNVTGRWEPKVPNPAEYAATTEAHERGSILVAAIFEAFIHIYKKRAADLFRIASNGTGVLPQGEIHPDLVNRLAAEASRVAQQVLNICIRALDYLPPVDITFGDYLRAMITADMDIVPDDENNYRVAFIEAFRKRGIYPDGVKTLSEDSLRWADPKDVKYRKVSQMFNMLSDWLKEFQKKSIYFQSREHSYKLTQSFKAFIHDKIYRKFENIKEFEDLTGLIFSKENKSMNISRDPGTGNPKFSVQSLAFNRRVGPNGNMINQVVFSLAQRAWIKKDPKDGITEDIKFRAGCTFIFDLDNTELLYVIKKDINDKARLEAKKEYLRSQGENENLTAFGSGFNAEKVAGPFAALHNYHN